MVLHCIHTGNIKNIMDRKRQIGLVGMLIGAGEITGEYYLFLLTTRTSDFPARRLNECQS